MPEGPEVKIITDQLNSRLIGKSISSIEILSGRYINNKLEGLDKLKSLLPLTIKNINCKGKFIYWNLDKAFLWNTLGMTGGWSFNLEKHFAAKLKLTTEEQIYFNDTRRFGTLKFVFSDAEMQTKLKSIGPDMLSAPPTLVEFNEILSKYKKKTLPEVLLNQKVISGVGNYVKAEVLYYSKLSPHRKVESLSDIDIELLYKNIIKVLQESYRVGGTSLRDYQDTNGRLGNFAQFLNVYSKKKDPEGRKVISEETLDKRTTWWCPEIQI